jgi:hypothetical protein
MSGTYMGKSLSAIETIFNIFEVEKTERRFILEMISMIDGERISMISKQKKQEDSARNQKSPP